MAPLKNEENLISQLLEETYEISETSKLHDTGCLQKYFELRTNQVEQEEDNPFVQLFYLKGISFFEVQYLEKIGAYRVKFNKNVIDFPENWGVFELIKNAMNTARVGLYRIKDFDETLYEVLSCSDAFNGEPSILVFRDNSYLFVLDDGDSAKLKMIQDLVDEAQIKKAS
ncbi:hypothetical protein M899_3456 [Bacteriovorax sp. BSW11_IV]|uniref:hypothetical protein n=1 Tax=Bacteriovorax sp. BSW11_IV TaxID=1353529 RepID=UPI00038A2E79|nr:hypothetical protein [Bacteriovorax sp. BSW11_IV]EQC45109.1 hypothetical protein M899_3456 [Bacteriovorax sp. BSW11_IV]